MSNADRRDLRMCRMWLLAIAVLHWVVFYLLTQQPVPRADNPKPVVSSFARAVTILRGAGFSD